MLIPLRKAVQELGLHPNTLRKYADEGKIKSIKNEAGQRLFDVKSYIGDSARTSFVCYCRVSSTKQRDDLESLVAYMRSLYPRAETITDIGSGINFKRKGLRSILDNASCSTWGGVLPGEASPGKPPSEPCVPVTGSTFACR